MKLLGNFISKLGVDSVSRLIGFVTLPVITRTLGPEGYGEYAYLFVIISYFGFFIDFGYLNYGTNKLCENIDSQIVIGKIISLQLLTAFFSYLVLIISAYFIFEFDKYILLLIFSFTFISQTLSIKYYYLANDKLYYNSFSELIGQVIYAALIFLVFIKYPSVLTLIIFTMIQMFVTAVILFIPYIKKNKIKIDLTIFSNLQTLKEAYKLGLATKAEAITPSFIILSLGILLNEYSVGLYNASYKIYLILLTVVQGLSYTLMPMLLVNVKIAGKINAKRISFLFYIYLSVGIILFLITFLFAHQIINTMFGVEFIDAVEVLKGFSFTILIWPIVMFMSLIILAYNKYNYLLFTSVSSAIFSVIFSIAFILFLGIKGAGLILPFVASGTILVSFYFLFKISLEKNFNITDIFSFSGALYELSNLMKGNIKKP